MSIIVSEVESVDGVVDSQHNGLLRDPVSAILFFKIETQILPSLQSFLTIGIEGKNEHDAL